MGIKRDLQSELAMITSEDISLTVTPGDFNGTGRQIKGFSRGYVVGFELSAALGGSDDVQYKFQKSSDNGSTDPWADLPAESYLPTNKQDDDNKLENPVSPYIQTAGVACQGELWVRLVLTVVSLAAATDVTVRYVLGADDTPFQGWTSTPYPNDGLP